MTQQEQDFVESLQAALTWMQAIHERLKANDNTQGPLAALEARLRETEKIHHSEHDGHMKVNIVLSAAEKLLQSADEELRNNTHAKLKDLKTRWEETCTYIVHCHSRIEWVWLHWSEYLKAYEEFESWLTKQQRSLDVVVELQLGVKEKLWQVDQQRVVVSDVDGQAALLERLLDEAAALHNRTQDPSVGSHAQERLQEAYNDVRDRAKERLTLLQKIAEEHRMYQSCVQKFQSWLLSKTKELTELMEKEDTGENKLKSLQALDDTVASEEKTLKHIEGVAEMVRANTSPAGAEVVVEEAEELRLGWQRLRQGLCEAEEGLRVSLNSHSQYMTRCQRLEDDIGRLRLLLQGLDHELENRREAGDYTDFTEEQMVGQWKKYTDVRNALAGEESEVELLKAQLKELFRFSEDSRHLSDDVLAVVKEHQSVKCRATKLCSESESGLRNLLQEPLMVYAQWSHKVSQVLEASAEVSDFSHIAMLVQNIERLLKESVQLQERFSGLQVHRELLDSVFGPETSDGLQGELTAAVRNRELLHTQLLQRKSRLQGLISRTKDFGDAYKVIRCKMTGLEDQLVAAAGLQPDILAKKSQLDQFRVIQKDLEDCEAHIAALETLVSTSQSNRTQFDRLYAEWRYLLKSMGLKVCESEKSIADHESFHDNLLNIEKWLMIMKQKLESFHSPSGEWSVEGRQNEAEKALGEFPEKELQLRQMEAQGQGVLEKTSEEGRVHIWRDMTRLQEAWLALESMSHNLCRLLDSSIEQTEPDLWRVGGPSVNSTPPTAKLILGKKDSQVRVDGFRSHRGQQQDQPAEVYGGLDSSGCGTGVNLEGTAGEEVTADYLKKSSFEGDEVDFSASSIHGRAGQRVSKDFTTDGSPGSDKSTGGDSSILTGDSGGALTAKSNYGEGAKINFGEGSVDPGEGPSPVGGAFLPFRRDSAKQPSTTPTQHTMKNTGQYTYRKREFDAWLCKQNELLSEALSTTDSMIRQDTLKALRSELGWGKEQFQLLLQESESSEAVSGPAEDMDLEDLRYRWILYKTKLNDTGNLRVRMRAKKVQANQEEPKVHKKPGLLQRVCRLALLLWLLLLALLLLAFFLPFMDEGSSCSLSNNFARSFNVMLRYDGPPPT